MRFHLTPILTLILLCATCNVAEHDKGIVQRHEVVTIPDVHIIVSLTELENNRRELLTSLFATMKKENEEKLPFDEPIHEYGWQLDGKLRPRWEYAYFHHKQRFGFNGDWYYTITKNSAPFVPQVCADFIVDTIDRTAGTWYAASLKYPKRNIGHFDMRSEMKASKLIPERVPDLMTYFHANPDKFNIILDNLEGEGPNTGNTLALQEWLNLKGAQYGDIIFIRGRAPWDHEKEMHYHSLFVSGVDKNNNVTLVFGNPGYPVERTLKAEMNRAPKRHVIAIVRLTDNFLKKMNAEK